MRRPGTQTPSGAPLFFGWKVVGAAFVLAAFTWGIGFYGPPVFMVAIEQTRGWSVTLVSGALTINMIVGGVVMTNLAALHIRFGVPAVTRAGAALTAAGLMGWALADQPWELFAITPLSGTGWALTSGAALNAIITPWFARRRPAAISVVYNGATVGGMIFAPLWAEAIRAYGFPVTAAGIGGACVLVVWFLAWRYFTPLPASMGLLVDGGAVAAPMAPAPERPRLTGWADRRLVTLTAGAALGLFAQVGLVMQLFAMLSSVFGHRGAGGALSLMTLAALTGRGIPALLSGSAINWRLVAMLNVMVQLGGMLLLTLSAGHDKLLLLIGTMVFGLGLGNATSLPPLIAQTEFAPADVGRVVARSFGVIQGCIAFAPLAFGALRDFDSELLFQMAGVLQFGSLAALLAGMRRCSENSL